MDVPACHKKPPGVNYQVPFGMMSYSKRKDGVIVIGDVLKDVCWRFTWRSYVGAFFWMMVVFGYQMTVLSSFEDSCVGSQCDWLVEMLGYLGCVVDVLILIFIRRTCPTVLFKLQSRHRKTRLVAVPDQNGFTIDKDMRPLFDRPERLVKTKYQRYQIALELESDGSFAYSNVCAEGTLGEQWTERLYAQFDHYPSWSSWFLGVAIPMIPLKTVELNSALIGQCLNRKTLLGARDKPELAVDGVLRLLSASMNFQEDLGRLLNDGDSVYRDMALVCGAIAARSVIHTNQYF